MKNSIPNEVRETRARVHLALAGDKIQCSLPVEDTPRLVEELLDTHVNAADRYLREQVQPPVVWFS